MKKTLLTRLLACLIPLFALVCIGAYWFAQDIFSVQKQLLKIDKQSTIKIVSGMSTLQVAQKLEQDGIIEHSEKVKFLVRLDPKLAHIKAGYYEIRPGDSLASLFKRIQRGQEMSFSVTLIEGKTIKEWKKTLADLPHVSFAGNEFENVLKANNDETGLPEGKFYPETFQYRADDTLHSILSRSYAMMQEALAEAWEGRDPELKLNSPYELLIIASIIEKETAKAEELTLVSAVFNNRLKKGMRLQTDPTIIYGMGDRFKGNITRKDLKEKTEFNTYQIDGLPPTPIAAPSRASLFAAANPAKVKYLFFVSRNDGSHVFSTTLAEHNAAVNEFQRRRKSNAK